MRSAKAIVTATIGLTSALAFSQNYKPPQGFVPDAATAIRIAVAVWVPIYGEKLIAAEKPYVATLKGDVWIVQGTLSCEGKCVGGVAVAQISKVDGAILKVTHGQ